MTQTLIQRTTEVVSVSMLPGIFKRLESARQKYGQSRSAFLSALIIRYTEDGRWEKIYKKGAETARKFKIKSEEDIDRILHEEDNRSL